MDEPVVAGEQPVAIKPVTLEEQAEPLRENLTEPAFEQQVINDRINPTADELLRKVHEGRNFHFGYC